MLPSELHKGLTSEPLEQTRWICVVYVSLWPSEMQTEPSVNSSSSRSRPSMTGPRLDIPMLLTDTRSFMEPCGGNRSNLYSITCICDLYYSLLSSLFTSHQEEENVAYQFPFGYQLNISDSLSSNILRSFLRWPLCITPAFLADPH